MGHGNGIEQEDGYRPAQRSERDHAVRRVEDENVPPEMVCGRSHLCWHWTGRGRCESHSARAHYRRNHHGWDFLSPARRGSGTDAAAIQDRGHNILYAGHGAYSDGSAELDNHHQGNGGRGEAALTRPY